MIDGLIILNLDGQPLLQSSFRQPSYYPAVHIDVFNEIKPKEPIYFVDTPPNGSACSYINVNDLNFLCPTSQDVDPLIPITFLNRFSEVLINYFGNITEVIVRDNFDIIYQLLEEMIDNGYPVTTETNTLLDIVVPPTTLSKLMTSAGVSTPSKPNVKPFASPIPWRKYGVKHLNNEIYFDIIEHLNTILDKNGYVIVTNIMGQLNCNSRLSGVPEILLTLTNSNLLEDVSCHPCIRFQRWLKDKSLSFVPPDGKFKLISYLLELKQIRQPVGCKTKMKLTENGGNFEINLSNAFNKQIENITVEIYLGNGAITANGNISKKGTQNSKSTSECQFEHKSKIFRWEISQLSVASTQTLTATFKTSEITPRPGRAFDLKFKIPNATSSGIKIDGLKISSDVGYKPFKGFKSALHSGSYEIRW